MREYFAPESGRGLGARDFAWTAALCLRAAWPAPRLRAMAVEPRADDRRRALVPGALRAHARARRAVHDARAASRSSRSTRRTTSGRSSERIGLPGEFPFTRGVYPSMYRGRLWTMRQFAGFGTAEETNERFRYLLDHGQTGLSTAFDMPSLMGHDSDHPRSRGRGRAARAWPSTRSTTWRRCSPASDMGEVSTSMTINAPAAVMLAFYVVAAERKGVAAGAARRHDPDGHPQGVHRPEGVVLPDRPGDAAGHRHDRVLLAADAALAPDLDLRLPHPRGRLDGRSRSSRSR